MDSTEKFDIVADLLKVGLSSPTGQELATPLRDFKVTVPVTLFNSICDNKPPSAKDQEYLTPIIKKATTAEPRVLVATFGAFRRGKEDRTEKVTIPEDPIPAYLLPLTITNGPDGNWQTKLGDQHWQLNEALRLLHPESAIEGNDRTTEVLDALKGLGRMIEKDPFAEFCLAYLPVRQNTLLNSLHRHRTQLNRILCHQPGKTITAASLEDQVAFIRNRVELELLRQRPVLVIGGPRLRERLLTLAEFRDRALLLPDKENPAEQLNGKLRQIRDITSAPTGEMLKPVLQGEETRTTYEIACQIARDILQEPSLSSLPGSPTSTAPTAEALEGFYTAVEAWRQIPGNILTDLTSPWNQVKSDAPKPTFESLAKAAAELRSVEPVITEIKERLAPLGWKTNIHTTEDLTQAQAAVKLLLASPEKLELLRADQKRTREISLAAQQAHQQRQRLNKLSAPLNLDFNLTPLQVVALFETSPSNTWRTALQIQDIFTGLSRALGAFMKWLSHFGTLTQTTCPSDIGEIESFLNFLEGLSKTGVSIPRQWWAEEPGRQISEIGKSKLAITAALQRANGKPNLCHRVSRLNAKELHILKQIETQPAVARQDVAWLRATFGEYLNFDPSRDPAATAARMLYLRTLTDALMVAAKVHPTIERNVNHWVSQTPLTDDELFEEQKITTAATLISNATIFQQLWQTQEWAKFWGTPTKTSPQAPTNSNAKDPSPYDPKPLPPYIRRPQPAAKPKPADAPLVPTTREDLETQIAQIRPTLHRLQTRGFHTLSQAEIELTQKTISVTDFATRFLDANGNLNRTIGDTLKHVQEYRALAETAAPLESEKDEQCRFLKRVLDPNACTRDQKTWQSAEAAITTTIAGITTAIATIGDHFEPNPLTLKLTFAELINTINVIVEGFPNLEVWKAKSQISANTPLELKVIWQAVTTGTLKVDDTEAAIRIHLFRQLLPKAPDNIEKFLYPKYGQKTYPDPVVRMRQLVRAKNPGTIQHIREHASLKAATPPLNNWMPVATSLAPVWIADPASGAQIARDYLSGSNPLPPFASVIFGCEVSEDLLENAFCAAIAEHRFHLSNQSQTNPLTPRVEAEEPQTEPEQLEPWEFPHILARWVNNQHSWKCEIRNNPTRLVINDAVILLCDTLHWYQHATNPIAKVPEHKLDRLFTWTTAWLHAEHREELLQKIGKSIRAAQINNNRTKFFGAK